MGAAVNQWSSPTVLYTDGLGQLPFALAGRPMLLVADDHLSAQIDLVLAVTRAAAVVSVSLDAPPDGIAADVVGALARHPGVVPVALGGGSVLDVVRLAALAAVDKQANGFAALADGPSFLPTRAVNPAICIPSTLGTGSEVSPVAVRATPVGTAMVISPGLRSAGAILDPRVTGTLPPVALMAGLIEPLARIIVPAVAGDRLRFQDQLARASASAILDLGDELAEHAPDDGWRLAAALASAQTHLGLLALGRAPAGHVLWPVATELTRATGLPKATTLAALLPAWMRCLDRGTISRAWGSADRVDTILGLSPAAAVGRLHNWIHSAAMPALLPSTTDVAAVVARVVHPWQSSGLFLDGVTPDEIFTVVRSACTSAGLP